MAGSIAVSTNAVYDISQDNDPKHVRKITIAWTGDASNGSVPALSIELKGWLVKAVTNPGSTAPTASYDIALFDPDDAALNVLAAALDNRHTSNGEQVIFAQHAAHLSPLLLAGTYSLAITANSVNSATGIIALYLADQI